MIREYTPFCFNPDAWKAPSIESMMQRRDFKLYNDDCTPAHGGVAGSARSSYTPSYGPLKGLTLYLSTAATLVFRLGERRGRYMVDPNHTLRWQELRR